jgi:hypothetical protein
MAGSFSFTWKALWNHSIHKKYHYLTLKLISDLLYILRIFSLVMKNSPLRGATILNHWLWWAYSILVLANYFITNHPKRKLNFRNHFARHSLLLKTIGVHKVTSFIDSQGYLLLSNTPRDDGENDLRDFLQLCRKWTFHPSAKSKIRRRNILQLYIVGHLKAEMKKLPLPL